jgi:hypothetical protein
MFMAGLIIFTVASLAGALAQSALWLVIARGAQGSARRWSPRRRCRSS